MAVQSIDQLQHSADVLADVDRHTDDRMSRMPDLLIDIREKEPVFIDVGGEIWTAGLIDAADDAMHRGEPLANQVAARLSERGDEDEVVVLARGDFAKRIVEEDRARLR